MPNNLVYWIQEAWKGVEETLGGREWLRRKFQQYNPSSNYFYFRRPQTGLAEHISEKDKENYEAFVAIASKAISESASTYIALGEMGSKLMEQSAILDAILKSKKKNYGSIEILHGPHVDPRTRTIFDFAAVGNVKMFQLPRYKPHHFILVKRADDTWFVAEENPHSEGLWNDKDLKTKKVYRSIHRAWYVLSHSQHRHVKLLEKFEKRKAIASVSASYPGAISRYRFITLRLFINTIFTFFPRFFGQPLAILRDNHTPFHKQLWFCFLLGIRFFIKILLLSIFMVRKFRVLIYGPEKMSSIFEKPNIISRLSSDQDMINFESFYTRIVAKMRLAGVSNDDHNIIISKAYDSLIDEIQVCYPEEYEKHPLRIALITEVEKLFEYLRESEVANFKDRISQVEEYSLNMVRELNRLRRSASVNTSDQNIADGYTKENLMHGLKGI